MLFQLTVPPEGFPGGSNFGLGPNIVYGEDWVTLEGVFDLSPLGEQVFLYCIGSQGVVPLAALSYNGPWQPAGMPNYGMNESALPDRLTNNGTITLNHCDNWEYKGRKSGTPDQLKAAMTNLNNWKGSTCTFSSGNSLTGRYSWATLFVVGLSMFYLC